MKCTFCGGVFDESGICNCGMDEQFGVDHLDLGRALPMRHDPAQLRLDLEGEHQTDLLLPAGLPATD